MAEAGAHCYRWHGGLPVSDSHVGNARVQEPPFVFGSAECYLTIHQDGTHSSHSGCRFWIQPGISWMNRQTSLMPLRAMPPTLRPSSWTLLPGFPYVYPTATGGADYGIGPYFLHVMGCNADNAFKGVVTDLTVGYTPVFLLPAGDAVAPWALHLMCLCLPGIGVAEAVAWWKRDEILALISPKYSTPGTGVTILPWQQGAEPGTYYWSGLTLVRCPFPQTLPSTQPGKTW